VVRQVVIMEMAPGNKMEGADGNPSDVQAGWPVCRLLRNVSLR
jgi:hypothetical protein